MCLNVAIRLIVISFAFLCINCEQCYWMNSATRLLPCFTGCKAKGNYLIRHSGLFCMTPFDYEYCCPAGGTGFDVVFCEHADFEGDCVVQSLQPDSMDCIDIENQSWASSVNTLGKCVRLYTARRCEGKSIVVSPVTGSHNDLGAIDMNDKVSSFSECFPMDNKLCMDSRSRRAVDISGEEFKRDHLKRFMKRQAAQEDQDEDEDETENQNLPATVELNHRVDRILNLLRNYQDLEGGIDIFHGHLSQCAVHFNELGLGYLPGLTGVNRYFPSFDGRSVFYQVDSLLQRTHTMIATIYPDQLRRGSSTTAASRSLIQAMTPYPDHAGHTLGRNLGGPGDDGINLFPQNSHYNNGIWKRVEYLVARVVRRMGRATFMVNLLYNDDRDMRPNVIVFRILGGENDQLIMVNAVPNPGNLTIDRRRG